MIKTHRNNIATQHAQLPLCCIFSLLEIFRMLRERWNCVIVWMPLLRIQASSASSLIIFAFVSCWFLINQPTTFDWVLLRRWNCSSNVQTKWFVFTKQIRTVTTVSKVLKRQIFSNNWCLLLASQCYSTDRNDDIESPPLDFEMEVQQTWITGSSGGWGSSK